MDSEGGMMNDFLSLKDINSEGLKVENPFLGEYTSPILPI
jgi:hypothetical protein